MRSKPIQNDTDHYAVLGVARTASQKEIARAFRKVAMQTHPDRVGEHPATKALYQAANDAYRILSDPELRAEYDRGFAPITSVMDLFRFRAAGRRVMEVMLPTALAAPCRGLPSLTVITLPSRDLRDGTVVDVRLPAQPESVPLHIPAGEDVPRWCRLAHLGHPGRNGGPSGDAWILVRPGPEETR